MNWRAVDSVCPGITMNECNKAICISLATYQVCLRIWRLHQGAVSRINVYCEGVRAVELLYEAVDFCLKASEGGKSSRVSRNNVALHGELVRLLKASSSLFSVVLTPMV
jgi:hypothetical protein